MATTFLTIKNRAYSKLAAAITDVITTITVTAGEGARFPSTYPFHITIDDEIMSCTNRSTDTLTVTRAQQNTTGAAHANKSYVALNITAQSMTDLNTAVNTIEATITGGEVVLADDKMVKFGTSSDIAMLLRSTSLNANTALTGVLIGTPVTQAIAADSLMVSNVTASGDIALYVNKGGHSQMVFFADASAGDTALMAASGASVDFFIAGSKVLDYATGAFAFQQNVTVSSTGTLTLGAITLSGAITGATQNMTGIGTIAATSLATTAAIPLLLTNGKLVNIALTSQTINPTTLTIPDFASVSDTFAFITLAQVLVNKTLTSPTINGTIATTGLTMPAFTLGGTLNVNSQSMNNAVDPTNAQDVATKAYVDIAASNLGFDYFFNNTASGVGAYYKMLDAPTGEAESTFTSGTLTTGNDQELFGWITDTSGALPFDAIQAGITDFHIHTYKASGTKSLVIYAKLIERKSGGALTTICTSETSSAITSKTAVSIHGTVSTDYELTSGSELVVIFYANVGSSGNDITVSLYAEGTDTSHVGAAVPSSVISNLYARKIAPTLTGLVTVTAVAGGGLTIGGVMSCVNDAISLFL